MALKLQNGLKLSLKGVHWLLIGLCFLWAGVVNLYLAIHWVCGDCVLLVAQLNHLAHWLLLLSGGIFFVAILLKVRRWRLLWFVPSVFFLVYWYGIHWLPKSSPEPKGIEITAATFNVWGFRADPEQTFDVIDDLDADFVGLQELRPTLQGKLRREMRERYPYQITEVRQGCDGLGLLSRYPILEQELVLCEWFTDRSKMDIPSYIRAVVNVEENPIVVYVFHPPIVQFEYLKKYDDSWQHTHTRAIIGLIERETLPVLLLCDCNTTPRSRQYALYQTVFENDAFYVKGWGLGLTYTEATPIIQINSPILRIDYVWYTEQFSALEARRWHDSGTSDHHPVWARLDFRSK